jgi:formamidopyrimidine-DNA glycosylase
MMPELPDVEVFRRYLGSTALHKTIDGVDVRSKRLLKGISERTLRSHLNGRKLQETHRHGKYLLIRVQADEWLVLHFGMTGLLKYFKNKHKEPEYTQTLISFKNGYHLAYVAPRKLGQIFLVDLKGTLIEEKELGPDVLDRSFDLEAFHEALSGSRGMIKSTLMSQKIMAGIGNIYSDEILFQARIHPKALVGRLDRDQRGRLFRALKRVLRKAIEVQADPQRLPSSYLIPHRDPEEKCPRCKGKVEKIEVSGRSGYYCPRCQSK